MKVTLNREPIKLGEQAGTVRGLLAERNIPEEAIVVAVNGDVIRRGEWDERRLTDGDEVEIVHAVAGRNGDEEDDLVIDGARFSSRLFLVTG